NIMLVSIPETEAAAKNGHAAKKKAKHQAAARPATRLRRTVRRTKVTPSPKVDQNRAQSTGAEKRRKPSAVHTVQRGDVKPITRSPGLNWRPLPMARFFG